MEQEVINGTKLEKERRSVSIRFGDYLFYKDYDNDIDDNSNVFAQIIYSRKHSSYPRHG